MKCEAFSSPERRPKSDACVLVCASGAEGSVIPLLSDQHLLRACHRVLESRDFRANEGEVAITYVDPVLESRLILVGVGEKDKATVETLRVAFASLSSFVCKMAVRSLSIITPSFEHLAQELVLRGVLEGMYFGGYSFKDYRSQRDEHALDSLFICCEHRKLFSTTEHEARVRMDAVCLVRDLVNRNADEVTPKGFSEAACSLEKDGLRVSTYGKEWIEAEQMHLLLAVARGSRHEPRFVVVEWRGAEASHDTTVLVGKGITFDSGGLNLKTPENMFSQRADMAGAASVLAVMQAARDLKLPSNIVAAIPLCENGIGCESYKPGDVYRSRGGKTVEIANTDAEGRLILADALSYVQDTFAPSRIIDIATLTGAAEVALGKDISALYSNTDALAYELEQAAIRAGDPLWRMPLYLPYAKLLESEIADCKNVGPRAGGSICAAVFLHSFLKPIPWAHFDIAGTAFLQEPRRYFKKGATGVPVRTLLEFFMNLVSRS